jgi:SAM-dependent methyltransferase
MPVRETGHVSVGLRRILEAPVVYRAFQTLVGARSGTDRFVREYVEPRGRVSVLDLGCGPATLLESLPRSTEYVGCDANARYIDHARRRYGSRGRFICCNVAGELSEVGLFDRVIATGLLHHLTDGEAYRLFESACKHLVPGGMLVARDVTLIEGQSRAVRWLISKDRGQCVRTPDGYRALADRVFPKVEVQVRTGLLRVPYTHCILRCTK